MTQRRLIEETFPLKKVSEDSKHEKNVRHGHISTLHIWPARRPLAACRAAIIAALLSDPGDEPGRRELNQKIESITRWGTENGPALDYFRAEIRRAFGGRAPRVLDMFAGGGAIPLEAMRLGCDVTAIDYNPVAWFILKCTLEFPQRLAGKTWPLPGGANGEEESASQRVSERTNGEYPFGHRSANGEESAKSGEPTSPPRPLAPDTQPPSLQLPMWAEESGRPGTLADHVRYWGEWVLARARAELAPYYPTIDDQPTVAYLWARTVPCPDPACGTEVPLLKTLELCKKDNKRRAIRLLPNTESHRVDFAVWTPGPKDSVPEGTMSGAKSRCPICGVNLTPDYIKHCGHAKQMGARITAVVVKTQHGKEYRPATLEEEQAVQNAANALSTVAAKIPYGLPTESQQKNPRTLIVQLYGLDTWVDLFNPRQLLTIATLAKLTRDARAKMSSLGYAEEWIEAVGGYLAAIVDKCADYGSSLARWENGGEFIAPTFQRFALPIMWDFAETNPLIAVSGSFQNHLNWVIRYLDHALIALQKSSKPTILKQSATEGWNNLVDIVITDPPYYDAIPYADLSDFFYVWLRRTVGDLYPKIFIDPATPKSDELALRLPHSDIPDDHSASWYEQMMAVAFRRAWEGLIPEGRMVIVFAHKDPSAWETLATAMIQSGFTVTASWPIDTERQTRVRSVNSAALSSSIWMVCRKRPENAGVGRYAAVKKAMQERVTERLRYFWDIGISGPDFVWAAVGPALEAYSAYDEVRRMDGAPFTVGEFLREVRRMTADFALGQILKGRSTEGVDEWTRYYLMHRAYFGLDPAPVGECIMLSQGYGLDLNELRGPRGFIVKGSGSDVRLAKWDERGRDDLGEPHPGGGLPQVDILHRLTRLWAAGRLDAINDYAAARGLRQNELFWAIAQAVLEMSPQQSRERTLLEAIVAWGRGQGGEEKPQQTRFV